MQIKIANAPEDVQLFFDPNYGEHLPFLEMSKEIFFLFKDLQQMNGWAFPKLNWLANRLGVSKRYVQKVIKGLRNAGLIEVKRREHNFYRLSPLIFQRSSLGREEKADRPEKNGAARPDRYQRRQGEALPKAADLAKEVSPEEAAAILADYQAAFKTSSVEASSAVIEQAVEGMATGSAAVIEEAIEPEVKAAVEEAAKQVKREHRDKPNSLKVYFEKVKDRLAAWKIEAPRLLIGDVVKAIWVNWGW